MTPTGGGTAEGFGWAMSSGLGQSTPRVWWREQDTGCPSPDKSPARCMLRFLMVKGELIESKKCWLPSLMSLSLPTPSFLSLSLTHTPSSSNSLSYPLSLSLSLMHTQWSSPWIFPCSALQSESREWVRKCELARACCSYYHSGPSWLQFYLFLLGLCWCSKLAWPYSFQRRHLSTDWSQWCKAWGHLYLPNFTVWYWVQTFATSKEWFCQQWRIPFLAFHVSSSLGGISSGGVVAKDFLRPLKTSWGVCYSKKLECDIVRDSQCSRVRKQYTRLMPQWLLRHVCWRGEVPLRQMHPLTSFTNPWLYQHMPPGLQYPQWVLYRPLQQYIHIQTNWWWYTQLYTNWQYLTVRDSPYSRPIQQLP